MKTVHKKPASIGREKQTQGALVYTSKPLTIAITIIFSQIKHANRCTHSLPPRLKTWISAVIIPCLLQDPFVWMYAAKGQTQNQTYMRCINYAPALRNAIGVRNWNHAVRLPFMRTDHFRSAFKPTSFTFLFPKQVSQSGALLENFLEQKRVKQFWMQFHEELFSMLEHSCH